MSTMSCIKRKTLKYQEFRMRNSRRARAIQDEYKKPEVKALPRKEQKEVIRQKFFKPNQF